MAAQIVTTLASPTFAQIYTADITLNEGKLTEVITGETTEVSVSRNIDQASTVTVTCRDPKDIILNAPFIAHGCRLTIGGYSFTLVQVAQQTGTLTLTFEDTTINLLRQKTNVITVAPGVMSRTDFAKRLVTSIAGLRYVGWPGAPKTKEALAVGSASDAGSGDPPEDYWAALVRQSSEVNWRCFAVGNTVYQGPDSWLLTAAPAATAQAFTAAVDYIDVDFDEGQSQGDATVYCYADLWVAPPGSIVTLVKKGPASGNWIVSEIARDLAHNATTVTLTQPQPALPEPADTTSTDSATSSSTTTDAARGTQVVAFVTARIGTPYGTGPGQYDCSSLTQAAYASVGITIPRVASDQYAAYAKVPQGQEQPGDICCFGTPVSHVGIYIGNNQMINSPHTGAFVERDPVSTFGDPPYVGAVRPN